MARSPLLPVAVFVAICALVPAYGQDAQRLAALTASRVTAALGYTPLNPASNLSDVAAPATARTNLGLGTAATQNTGTSGATLCLLSGSCSFSGNVAIGKTGTPGYALDVAFPVVGASATRQMQFSDYANTTLSLFASTTSAAWTSNVAIGLASNNSATPQLAVATNGVVGVGTTSATGQAGELALAKTTASGTAPGAGNLKLAVVAGTIAGTCKIIAYAGTSTTPATVTDNVGSGC